MIYGAPLVSLLVEPSRWTTSGSLYVKISGAASTERALNYARVQDIPGNPDLNLSSLKRIQILTAERNAIDAVIRRINYYIPRPFAAIHL